MAILCANDRVITVANLKGGVGKTTTVLNLADFAPTSMIAQEYRRAAELILIFLEEQR